MYKNFRFIFQVSLFLFMTGVLSSCTILSFSSEKDARKLNEVYKKGNETTSVKADKKGEELVRAIVENNADAFLKQLPEKLLKEFGSKDFERTRNSMVKELGVPVSYTYLRNMAHPVAAISLWVIRFERTPSAGNDKEKKIIMEVLFRVVYGKIDGKDTLLSFNFY